MPALNIVRLRHLNLKNVLDKVYDEPDVRVYLPDFERDAARRINRNFLFQIVNKIDPNFFPLAIKEIEARTMIKAQSEAPTTIQIKPELLAILKSAQSDSRNQRSSASGRVLKALLAGTKKRKRKDLADPIEKFQFKF